MVGLADPRQTAEGLEPPKPKRAPPDQKEHRLQGWCDRMIDRVLLPPVYVTGVDMAGEETQNSRARAQGRGIKFGTPDHHISQGAPLVVAWIELKIGDAKPTDRQWARICAIRRTGAYADYTSSVMGVLEHMRRAGFRLVANADQIAAVVTAEWQADERKRALSKAPRSRSRGKPRASRPSSKAIAVGARFQRP